jgi:rhamnogalacturonyl hydrolase YesR
MMKDTQIITKISQQYSYFLQNIPETNEVPRFYSEQDGLFFASPNYWTCGFPPGSLWYLYELTGDDKWKDSATVNTLKLNEAKSRTNTHDLGFLIFCSFGNAYRITQIEEYKNVIIEASDTLIKRFNHRVGCIRSWDHGTWQYPVIIDNLMNLEMLFWASDVTGNKIYREVAISHADLTMQDHYRSDGSCCHLVDYDPENGQINGKFTHQGYSDESSWSRGQAWGLYGFTMCYRMTSDERYLHFAEKIAAFIIDKSPDDNVPYWDYDAPNIPNEPRDASAAALIASALYELSSFVSDKKHTYVELADDILESLNSSSYFSEIGTNGGFLLMHSTGNKPANSEIDVGINYADYYYLEALKRQQEYKF